MSKRIRSNVEVILSQDLRQNGGLSAIINYRPIRNVELRAISRDNSDRGYSVRHELNFGGGAPVAAAQRETVDVSAVHFDGAGADEAALRDRLRLTEGDRFDFVRWRDDVDRLQEWYREQRHLEARVRPSRATAADGTAVLTYRVTAGPETVLDVAGATLSANLAEAPRRGLGRQRLRSLPARGDPARGRRRPGAPRPDRRRRRGHRRRDHAGPQDRARAGARRRAGGAPRAALAGHVGGLARRARRGAAGQRADRLRVDRPAGRDRTGARPLRG